MALIDSDGISNFPVSVPWGLKTRVHETRHAGVGARNEDQLEESSSQIIYFREMVFCRGNYILSLMLPLVR